MNLTDFIWRVVQHTPMRIKLFLYCAPGMSGDLVRTLKQSRVAAAQLSRGVVVVYRAEQIWALLEAIGATLSEPQRHALVRYVQAHRAGRKWRRGSSEEYAERCGATEEVCREFGLEYKGVAAPDQH